MILVQRKRNNSHVIIVQTNVGSLFFHQEGYDSCISTVTPNMHNQLIGTSIKELHMMAKIRIYFQYCLETIDRKLSQTR